MKISLLSKTFLIGSTIAFLGACGGSGNDDTPPSPSVSEIKRDVIQNYANIASASYEDSLTTALILQEKIEDFISDPNETTLDAAKKAWLDSREPYGQTEVFRFYSGPIDRDPDGPEGQLNAWPLDEKHIDYVVGEEEDSSIINSDQSITYEYLISQNGLGGEANVATGYHAIEFLLWGQDLNANPSDAGLRPLTDYTTDLNASRRKEYLKVVTEILVDDLDWVASEWSEDIGGNYREQFLQLEPDEALRLIAVGVTSLSYGELGAERMQNAIDTGDQEDEHSCFSDNTHRDILNNALGIDNILKGAYERVDGTTVGTGIGLNSLFDNLDREGNQDALAYWSQAMTAIEQIDSTAKQGTAFDQQILINDANEDRTNILATIDFLYNFTEDYIAVVEENLDISLKEEVDPNGE